MSPVKVPEELLSHLSAKHPAIKRLVEDALSWGLPGSYWSELWRNMEFNEPMSYSRTRAFVDHLTTRLRPHLPSVRVAHGSTLNFETEESVRWLHLGTQPHKRFSVYLE